MNKKYLSLGLLILVAACGFDKTNRMSKVEVSNAELLGENSFASTDVISCPSKPNELLERYEAVNFEGLNAESSAESPTEILRRRFAMFSKFDPSRAERFERELNEFDARVVFLDNVDLKIDTQNWIAIPEGCRLAPVALFQSRFDPKPFRFLIDAQIYSQLSNVDKAAVMLNSIILMELIGDFPTGGFQADENVNLSTPEMRGLSQWILTAKEEDITVKSFQEKLGSVGLDATFVVSYDQEDDRIGSYYLTLNSDSISQRADMSLESASVYRTYEPLSEIRVFSSSEEFFDGRVKFSAQEVPVEFTGQFKYTLRTMEQCHKFLVASGTAKFDTNLNLVKLVDPLFEGRSEDGFSRPCFGGFVLPLLGSYSLEFEPATTRNPRTYIHAVESKVPQPFFVSSDARPVGRNSVSIERDVPTLLELAYFVGRTEFYSDGSVRIGTLAEDFEFPTESGNRKVMLKGSRVEFDSDQVCTNCSTIP